MDLIDVRRPVIHRIAVPRKSMSRQHDGVIIVSQHIFNLFLERPTRDLHRLSGEFIQTLFADIPSGDPAPTRHVKSEIFRTRPQIAVNITATERGVGFADGCF
jgi:hypothetical protein